MRVVHTIGFANMLDSLRFAQAVWDIQSKMLTRVRCEVDFVEKQVQLTGHVEDIEAIVGDLPPLSDCQDEG